MATPAPFLHFVDQNAQKFVDRLAQAVAIPSVSVDGAYRPDVIRMSAWLNSQLTSLGVTTQLTDLGVHVVDGKELPLPPVILGKIGDDPKKKTVLVYGHYDVQPAEKSDGWDTEPFELVEDKETGRLVGRGSTDDKGPILGWLNVLEAHKSLGLDLPVNLRFCFEGMEESSSDGLDELIRSEVAKGNQGWFHGVDCVCISDNYWQNTRTPCLTYGLRGIAFFHMTVSGPGRDLHSGGFGRVVHEPMTDLIFLMGRLVAPDGTILIPGVEDMIAPPDAEERAIYEKLDYSIEDVDETAGASIALSDDKATVLMGRMRMPALSLHGIEGAFSGPGGKTVIPAHVAGKFSLRLVPPQTPASIETLVVKHVKEEFAKLKSKNTLTIELMGGGMPWVEDYKHWNYEAARRATEAVYKQTPDLTREGGSIPVTLTFAENLGVNVLLLPMGRGDDGAHSTNEKLDRSNFIEGSKLIGTYLYEVAAINA
ncbi:Cys-Gly metallodipeptidase dug1 [Trametes pubescens]|uniref:Cys-Gly metallodipeptidase dug1 n=1 Tax=Trametes pubescens TaxID=154538 RepID=A0A1M2VW76_TRAPU|nr:Cys-Gly metallodipeptidase dug1 [Trametes pubescens]